MANQFQPSASSYYQVSVSPDGEWLAHIEANNQVGLVNGPVVSKFVVNGPAVSGVAFTPNNTLLVLQTDGTLSFLDPADCPATFANIDSVCKCSVNATLNGGICQCNNNFISDPDNRTCHCP